MNQLESIKTKGKETFDTLISQGKNQPESVQKWGVTGAAAVGGAVAVGALAKGLLGIIATLANPPVALTVGAVGGGLLGWSFIQNQLGETDETGETGEPVVETKVAEAEPITVTVAPAEA